LRPLIEKGFELDGAPIAKLPPAEEKLWFAKRHGGKSAAVARKSKKGRVKVMMGSTGSPPAKKKAVSKRKAKNRKQEES
jgi:hypothetical protein